MKQDLKNRTKKFSVDIVKFIEYLPNTISGRTIANQLVRSGTSVGANYRAACRSRSDKEFIAKMNIVLEEADESAFWLEVIDELSWINRVTLEPLLNESNEITAIIVSSLKTVHTRIQSNKI